MNGHILVLATGENYSEYYYRLPSSDYDSVLDLITPKVPRTTSKEGLTFTNSIETKKKFIYNTQKYLYTTFVLYDTIQKTPTLTHYNGTVVKVDSTNIYMMIPGLSIRNSINNTNGTHEYQSYCGGNNYDSSIQLKMQNIKYCFFKQICQKG